MESCFSGAFILHHHFRHYAAMMRQIKTALAGGIATGGLSAHAPRISFRATSIEMAPRSLSGWVQCISDQITVDLKVTALGVKA
jgi:hypothetical protein